MPGRLYAVVPVYRLMEMPVQQTEAAHTLPAIRLLGIRLLKKKRLSGCLLQSSQSANFLCIVRPVVVRSIEGKRGPVDLPGILTVQKLTAVPVNRLIQTPVEIFVKALFPIGCLQPDSLHFLRSFTSGFLHTLIVR